MADTLYLDYAAATPVDPRVVSAMEPYLADAFGNPSSVHAMGVAAKRAVEEARALVAKYLNAGAEEILFTSGGTEANNLALLGFARANADKGRHLITTAIEHHSVLHTFRALAQEGFTVTELAVEEDGRLDPQRLADALTDETILVSVGYANNEIGVIQPMRELKKVLHGKAALFHTDAVQAAGALSLDVVKLGVGALSLSGSKIYGPKGVGALYLKKGIALAPLLRGGSQQRGVRPGTENVAGIVGFAKALELAQQEKEEEAARLTKLRGALLAELQKAFPNLLVNGSREQRLPNNINVTFPGIDGEAVVLYASEAGIMLSTGSACSTVDPDPSHVLQAIGRTEEEAHSSLRITLGRFTEERDIGRLVGALEEIFRKLTTTL